MVGHESLNGSPTQAATPYRSLGAPLLAALEAATGAEQATWWADVLADPDLVLAVRDRALNVYYRGASLFRITATSDRLEAETHVKYLMRRRQASTRLGGDGRFDHTATDTLWQHYEGPATLAEMKRAAIPLAGSEKTGLHTLVQASANVIDVEIALAGAPIETASDPDGSETEAAQLAPVSDVPTPRPRQDRLDVASVETRGETGEAWLVFHEVKLASNPTLRAKGTPAVVEQIARYRATLAQEAERLAASYPALCRDLVRLDALRHVVRAARGLGEVAAPTRDPMIADVASGARTLRLDPEPRLTVIDFDADQRDGALKGVIEILRDQHGLQVYAIGRPGKGTAAFRGPRR